jgi:hypothetical protein
MRLTATSRSLRSNQPEGRIRNVDQDMPRARLEYPVQLGQCVGRRCCKAHTPHVPGEKNPLVAALLQSEQQALIVAFKEVLPPLLKGSLEVFVLLSGDSLVRQLGR